MKIEDLAKLTGKSVEMLREEFSKVDCLTIDLNESCAEKSYDDE